MDADQTAPIGVVIGALRAKFIQCMYFPDPNLEAVIEDFAFF